MKWIEYYKGLGLTQSINKQQRKCYTYLKEHKSYWLVTLIQMLCIRYPEIYLNQEQFVLKFLELVFAPHCSGH